MANKSFNIDKYFSHLSSNDFTIPNVRTQFNNAIVFANTIAKYLKSNNSSAIEPHIKNSVTWYLDMIILKAKSQVNAIDSSIRHAHINFDPKGYTDDISHIRTCISQALSACASLHAVALKAKLKKIPIVIAALSIFGLAKYMGGDQTAA